VILLRQLLHLLALVAGTAGLWIGGRPLVAHLYDRVDGDYIFDPDGLFRATAIFLSSLILLVLLEFRYACAHAPGVRDSSEEADGDKNAPLGNLSGTPWDPKRKS